MLDLGNRAGGREGRGVRGGRARGNIYKRNRESFNDVPGPYWCIRLNTHVGENRLSQDRLPRVYNT